jgi:hypothetical protein
MSCVCHQRRLMVLTRLGELMINVFVLQNGRLNQVNIDSRADLEKSADLGGSHRPE